VIVNAMQEREIEALGLKAMSAAEGGVAAIYSNEEYEQAAARVLELSALKSEIKDTFDPVVTAAHQTHKEAVAARNKHLSVVEKAITILKDLMAQYHSSLQEMAEEDADNDAIVVTAPPPAVDGISTRTTWSAKVVDQEALVVFIAQDFTKWGKLLKVDQVALNKFARSLNEGLSAVLPGVEAVCKRGVAVRA
jgi:hypothetical protein